MHSTVYLQGQMTSVEAVASASVVQSLSPRELGRGEVSPRINIVQYISTDR